MFDRAADLDDQGRPVDVEVTPHPCQAVTTAGRKTPMTLDWEPDPAAWQRACFDRGLPVDADVHLALVDFREHYAAQPGRTATPADWTRRFARWVHENLQRQLEQPAATGGASHANRRDRTPARRLTAAEARARDRERRHAEQQGGRIYDAQGYGG